MMQQSDESVLRNTAYPSTIQHNTDSDVCDERVTTRPRPHTTV